MDAIVTYVDGLDPLWRQDYERTVGKEILDKRFRDWGTLRYQFRGMDRFMPFIDRIHLVVARESQVPDWVNRETVNVVLHKDIIPADILPVFNSCTIETFLPCIPGLTEEFIYFNDDMYPVAPCEERDFFRDGKGVIGMSRHIFRGSLYKKQCKVSSDLALKALGRRGKLCFVRPQHICSPMLLSSCKAVSAAVEDEIMARASRTRTPDNPNQYLFLDYMYYSGKLVGERISNKHFSLAAHSIDSICEFIRKPSTKLACINDVHMDNDKFLSCREKLLAAFEDALPGKSRFEL